MKNQEIISKLDKANKSLKSELENLNGLLGKLNTELCRLNLEAKWLKQSIDESSEMN